MPPKITQNIDIITRFKTFSKGFTAVMGKNMQQLKDVTKNTGQLNTRMKGMNNTGAIAAHRFRQMTHGARGFKMELLGIMFFGMMIQRAFFGLLKTSIEWAGVMEIMSVALGILFLPVALMLLDWAILFLDWVGKLSEEQKKWIGVIVLTAAALGVFLFILGSVGLGIGSLLVGIGELSGSIRLMASASRGATIALTFLKVAIGKVIKFGAIGITIAMAVKDLTEGQITAAIGMATLGVGIYTGNPYLIGIGLTLKLIGDEDFLVDLIKFMMKMVDIFFLAGETAIKAFWAAITGREFDLGSTNLGKTFQRAVLEQQAAGGFESATFGRFNLPERISVTGGTTAPGGSDFSAGEIITINNVNNFNGFTTEELLRVVDQAQINNTEELRRVVGGQ